MARKDAINKCIELGELFVEHFDKIYNSPNDINVHHWSKEMQAWYDKARRIKLSTSNRPISTMWLLNWFGTLCGDVDTVFNNEVEAEIYEDFLNDLVRSENVEYSINHIFNKE